MVISPRKAALPVGCGGSIGFVGPLAELFGGAPEQSGHVGELFDELGLVLAGA